MSMGQRFSLSQQINRKLQSILGRYIVATALLMFLVAVGVIGGFHRKQLEQFEALIVTKISSELTALIREADSLANSSVVWTGLTDSAGREIYLEPLLARINRNSAHRIDLLDYRGRDYILSQKAGPALRMSPTAIDKTIQTLAVQAEFHVTDQGRVLLLSLPIVAPFADGVLGIMLIHVNLDQELQSLRLPANLEVGYALLTVNAPPESSSWLTATADVPIRFNRFEIPLRIEVTQPVWGRLMLALAAVFVLLVSGYLLYRTVTAWSAKFAQSLTDRIERLVEVTSKAASQGDVHVEKDTVGDEISAMFDAVQSIVLRQRSINQKLLVSSRVFETAAEAILITDKDGCIADVNEALLRITGYRREEIMGQAAGMLYRQQEPGQDGSSIGEAMRIEGEWRGETYFLTREHTQIPVMMAVSSLSDEQHNNLGNVAIISDIREIKRVEERQRELIYQDQLTGLPNYRAFTEFIENKLQSDRQSGTVHRFALLFIDLDHLKFINDNYGHEQGDQVIVQFAHYLQDKLPHPHFLCRRSGDEFIAVLDIDERSQDLRARLEAALPLLTHQIRLTSESYGKASFSMGAAVYPEHANNVSDLLVLADSALLISKEKGRSCITWLDGAIIHDIQRRHLLETKLRTALQARGITPHYQPEVDMRTGRITGFEALARWHDAELGDISPSEFIPIAEEQGLIDQVTEVLLEKLIADLPSIRAVFPEAAVAFNASAGLLSDQKLARFLKSHLGSAHADFSGLILEVTETDLMHSVEEAISQLEAIIAMGVQIAIDDFGKEYSSLARLVHLPIRKLKIDQSFVDALNDEGNIKVVSSIMALTRTLALDVTAEGVEEEFQCNMLMAMGCWKGQGFLFARPMPLAELLVLPSHLSIQPADDGIAEDKKNPQVVEN